MANWKKYEKDGKVAVIYSPGYGAGWSTWNDGCYRGQMTMDSRLVQLVLDEKEITEGYLREVLQAGDEYLCLLADELAIKWVPKGCLFKISEYDGHEGVDVASLPNSDFATA